MTVRTKVIGRQPTDHGPYNPAQSYGKRYQVELYGCVWESLHDNNITAPAVWDGGDTITPNTADWKKVSGSYESWLLSIDKPAESELYPFNGLGKKTLAKNIAPLTESAPFNGFVEGVTAEATLSGTPTQIFWDRMNTRFVGIKDGVYYLDWTDSDNYVPVSTSLVYMYNGTPYQWTGSDFIVDETEVPNLVNCLTQDMINEANTIYIIRYDYTLKEDITIPANCVLKFDGGSLNNGTLIGNNTVILAGNNIVFDNILFDGTFKNKNFYTSWITTDDDLVSLVQAVCENNATLVVNSDLDIYGKTIRLYNNSNIVGDGGSMYFHTVEDRVAIQGGIENHPWHGEIKGLTLNLGDYKFGIAMINASNCRIVDNTIYEDGTKMTWPGLGGKVISRFNDATLARPSITQENYYIARNKIYMAPDRKTSTDVNISSESISVADQGTNIIVEGNYIYNSTDDLGMHNVDNVTIKDNIIYTTDARIQINSCENVEVLNNYLCVVRDGSMGICTDGTEYNTRPCRHLRIIGNRVTYSGTGTLDYGIRIMNGKDIVIENNTIDGQLSIEQEPAPTGRTEEDMQVDDVRVLNNVINGNFNGTNWNTSKFALVQGNIISGYCSFPNVSNVEVVDNFIETPTNIYSIEQYIDITYKPLVNKLFINNVEHAYNYITGYIIPYDCYLLKKCDVYTDNALSQTGTFTYQLYLRHNNTNTVISTISVGDNEPDKLLFNNNIKLLKGDILYVVRHSCNITELKKKEVTLRIYLSKNY